MRRRVLALLLGVAAALAGLAGIPFAEAAHSAPVRAAAAPLGSPSGAFDNVSARFDNKVVVSGWAADRDAPQAALTVHLYVGSSFIGALTTGDKRPDVANAVPPVMPGVVAGPSTGWHTTLTAEPLAWNPALGDLVCAYGINLGPGTNSLLGCRHIQLAGGPSPANPIGFLESAKPSPGLIQLSGWASDPDGTRTTQLRISFDGSEVLETTTSVPRPDVSGLGPSGFNLTLPMMPGLHSICVDAQNTGLAGLQNATLGCVRRTVPGAPPPGAHDPQGTLDRIAVDDVDHNGLFRWHSIGWAYDPDASGPINVRVRTLGRTPSFAPPNNFVYFPVVAGAFRPRPDVANVFPAAGPNSGFDATMNPPRFPEMALTCAYAVNVGPGTSRFLGCFAPQPV
jgi:hypothetical protein